MKKLGAENYTQDLYNDGARWRQAVAGIETGQRDWLRLAQAIKPAADGAVAEELEASLAKALLVDPSSVLRLLSPKGSHSTWQINVVCGGPIPSPGKAWLSSYKVNAIRAVQLVRARELNKRKRQCIRALKAIDLSKSRDAFQ